MKLLHGTGTLSMWSGCSSTCACTGSDFYQLPQKKAPAQAPFFCVYHGGGGLLRGCRVVNFTSLLRYCTVMIVSTVYHISLVPVYSPRLPRMTWSGCQSRPCSCAGDIPVLL